MDGFIATTSTFMHLPEPFYFNRDFFGEKLNKIMVVGIIFIALLLAGFGAWYHLSISSTFSGTPLPITIGGPKLETSALIYIADDQHFFEKNGLNVTIREYDSGGSTIAGLLKNEVDVGMASEFVLVNNIFNNENISGFGSIDEFYNIFLVARKDRGIENISDLKGKTIGIPRGTAADFSLGQDLILKGMNLNDVSLVDVRAPESGAALANGSVDAVVTWRPYLDEITELPEINISMWAIQRNRPTYWVAISRKEWIPGHQTEIVRFLRSIAEARQFSLQHPDETRSILKKRLTYSDRYLSDVLPDNEYSLSLDQSMILTMEDEARWMIENNLTDKKKVPNYLNYIYFEGLEQVTPDTVSIIH